MDCSLPGSSAREILQARILKVGCHAHLQGTFLIQGSKLHLLWFPHCRQILYCWATEKAPLGIYYETHVQFSSVQSLSHVWLFVIPWTAACQASLSITNSQSLPKLMSIESVMPSNHLILCHPLLLPPSIFPSIRVFKWVSLHIRWQNYWSFSFSISPSNEYSGQISFKMDWLDLLAVQGTFKSLLQQHSSKASILQCSSSHVNMW